MPGTKAGNAKAMATIRERYGDDYHKRIGSLGGRARSPMKGFGADRERARIAGAKGGRKSRRNGVSTGQGKKKKYYYNGDKRDITKSNEPEIILPKSDEYKGKSFIERIFGR